MRVIGLMSGTSADGIDAALVTVRRRGGGLDARLEAFRHLAYAPELRRRLLDAADGALLSAEEFAILGRKIGQRQAAAVRGLCAKAAIPTSAVDLVGCHGHTLHHDPSGARVTWQIGEAAVVAVRTGITTVADFRSADVAAGGEGAPLVPAAHAWLFRHATRGRAIQNLGGIGNVTYLPPGSGLDGVVAFDTGPGNMLIDAIVRRATNGACWFDGGGRGAARGRVNEELVQSWLRHPYFRRRPPKSTGRELFGKRWVDAMIADAKRCRVRGDDLLATATALTAASCADAYRRFLVTRGRLDELWVCGGGSANRTLLAMLRARLPGVAVGVCDDLGTPSRAVESVAFALLAAATALGLPGNVPAATGAARPLVLGKVVPGARYDGLRLRTLGVRPSRPRSRASGRRA
jgi:anhydro-N-acetylmuramic acid kinase